MISLKNIRDNKEEICKSLATKNFDISQIDFILEKDFLWNLSFLFNFSLSWILETIDISNYLKNNIKVLRI